VGLKTFKCVFHMVIAFGTLAASKGGRLAG
jgi:hypothetical protein